MVVPIGTFDWLVVQVLKQDYTHSQSQEENRVETTEDSSFQEKAFSIPYGKTLLRSPLQLSTINQNEARELLCNSLLHSPRLPTQTLEEEAAEVKVPRLETSCVES